MEGENFYETMSGESILFMEKKSDTMVVVTTDEYEKRILDPILSKVRAGISTLYVEEIPEYQSAMVGQVFVPRR